MSEIKRVYRFGGRNADGDGSMRNLLGGKGANLAEMCKLGIPVPAGFTITTDCCTEYYANGCEYPAELKAEVDAALAATLPSGISLASITYHSLVTVSLLCINDFILFLSPYFIYIYFSEICVPNTKIFEI